MSSEHAVREAATQLQAAITAAEKDGYRIGWPSSAAGLAAIAISETGRVMPTDVTRIEYQEIGSAEKTFFDTQKRPKRASAPTTPNE